MQHAGHRWDGSDGATLAPARGRVPRRWIAAAVALLVVVLTWGDPPRTVAGGGGAATRGGVAVLGLTQEPATLNQFHVQGGWPTFVAMKSVFDQWIEIDPKNRLVPQMARQVPTTRNGGVTFPGGDRMDVSFDIHPRARWSDGTPVTCADMHFTWKTMLDDRWLIISRNGWEKIGGVSCPGPRRVVVHFTERYAPWPNVLRAPPLPAHVLKGKDFNDEWSRHVTVGSGPFVVDEWKPGVYLKLKRNPRFWRAGPQRLPHLDGIEYRFFKTENAINLQMSSGELHLLNRGLENTLQDERKLFPGKRVLVTPGTGARVVGLQTRRLPDRRVRQAIAYAIDRRQIAELLMGRPFRAMQSTLGTQQGSLRIPAWSVYRRDPAKVAALLEAAGYQREDGWWTKDGTVLTIDFKSYAEKTYIRRIVQVLQQQLEREGIRMKIALEPMPVLYGQSMPKANYDMGLWGIGLGYDPEQRGYFACPKGLKTKNPYRYCDDAVTELFERSNRARTMAERRPIVHEIQRRMAKDVPVLPLIQDFDQIVHSPELHGIVPNSQANVAWNAAEWWLG